MSASDSHASRVARLRLRALVDSQRGGAASESVSRVGSAGGAIITRFVDEPSEFGSSLGLVIDEVAWVMATARHEQSLGPALMWALRNNASALKLFMDNGAADLARCAAEFDFAIDVFSVDASGVAQVVAPRILENLEVSVADELFAEFIKSAGAEVVREHGVISGEVCGLEVCRVVPGSNLEIGVGAHDRETFKLLHGHTATVESLRKVVEEVVARRAVGAQVHPLNQLARERMLRHYVCQSPQLVGAEILQPAQPPVLRKNLKDTVPCCAVGVLATGEKVVVIFSVGVDPDVVAFGADARGQLNNTAELIFAMPTRDIVPAVERVAQLLRRPARFVGVDVLSAQARLQV